MNVTNKIIFFITNFLALSLTNSLVLFDNNITVCDDHVDNINT